MKIELTKSAREAIDESIDKNSKFLLINLVKYDCHGAVLSMTVSDDIGSNNLYEIDGYKFIMDKEESEMFKEINIDYKSQGLNEGFAISYKDSSLGQCFITDEID
ncbi:MAG: iron-sulfur cluster biosynthesis family protein [Tissierellia bacterium]|nr:iron-sulfur cluster biosynthesis family protein [Tissierellia bacterium]